MSTTPAHTPPRRPVAQLVAECRVCGTAHDDALHGAVLRARGQLRAEVLRMVGPAPESRCRRPVTAGMFEFPQTGGVRIIKRTPKRKRGRAPTATAPTTECMVDEATMHFPGGQSN